MVAKVPYGSKIKNISLPNSLTILKRAVKLRIDGYILKTENYIDLQSLIFSLEIDELQQYLATLKKQKDAQNGISERVEASEEDFNNL